ncbi:MAG: protein kinase [bacterium]
MNFCRNSPESASRPSFVTWLCGVLLVTILLPSLSPAQNSQTEANTFYKKALAASSLSEKVRLFEKAIEIEPYFVNAHYQLGIAYYQKSDYTQAIQALTGALDLAPEKSTQIKLYIRNAYSFLAMQQIENEEFTQALTTAQHALDLDNNYAQAFTARGLAYFGLGDRESAIREYKKSLAIDENQETAWNKLGDVYLRTKDYHKAIDAYERALSLDPDLKDAKRHLRIARRRNRPEAWLTRFTEVREKSGPEPAIGILKEAQTLFPNDKNISETLKKTQNEFEYQNAVTAMEEGDWPVALEILQRVDPEYEDTARRLEEVKTFLAAELDSTLSDSTVVAQLVKHDSENSDSTTLENPIAPSQGLSKNTALPISKKPDRKKPVTPDRPVSQESSGETPTLTHPIVDVFTESAGTPDTVIIASQNDGTPHENEPSLDAAVTDFTAGHIKIPKWLWFVGLGSVLVISFLLMKRSKRTSDKAGKEDLAKTTEVALSGESDDVFKDEVASVTPVTFESLDAGETLEDDTLEKQPESEEESMALKDTQTILGGIKKVRRIGRYVLEREIGRGSMGLIYKAWDPKLDRSVVIKQVAFHFSEKEREVARLKDRLLREARAAGRLNHENIVVIYDVEEEKDFSYIVMEFLDGHDLKTVMESGRTFEFEDTIKIVSQICSALSFANQNGIIHRDIKPSNIILIKNDKIKVADFGIAKFSNLGTLTQTGSIVGTPFYMSPEQIEGRKLDGRSDIFSCGVILYELLTQKHPFEGDNISTVVYKIVHQTPALPTMLNPDLPAKIDSIVECACAKDAKYRYTDAQELMLDLQKLAIEFDKS